MYNPYDGFSAYGANPYQPAYRAQSPQWQGVRFVSGLAEAQSCYVPLGFKTILMDSNEDKFYLKENDFNGVSTVSQYSFSKIEKPAADGFVTHEEFDRWKESYESAIRQQIDSALRQPAENSQPGPPVSQDNPDDAATGTGPGAAVREGQFRF